MSIQFTVAAVLVHGRLDDEVFRSFAPDGETAALARRVRLENNDELAQGYPQRQGAEVIVTLRDGRTVGRRLLELEPLDAAGVRRRTRAALARLLGEARAAEVEREIDALTGSPDAARIARLLARD
jgi:2-methylcitrate dehydratase PrpD